MECIKIWLSLRLQLRWSHSLCQYSLTLFCRYQVQLSSQVSNAHEWEILFSDWWSHKRSIVQRRIQSHGLDVWKISISSIAKYYLLGVPNWKEFCMTLKTKARIKFQVDHTATVKQGRCIHSWSKRISLSSGVPVHQEMLLFFDAVYRSEGLIVINNRLL